MFSELSAFHSLKEYQYVGFGSTYFSDFSLFHKNLGIDDMVSIEQDKENKIRFMFNRPYSCIKMEFESSNDILPSLDWGKPSIAWLDYDIPLDAGMLQDLTTLGANMQSGSLILISVNAHHLPVKAKTNEETWGIRLKELEERVTPERIPLGTTGKNLNAKGNSDVYKDIITNEIKSVLKIRNGDTLVSSQNYLHYKEVVNIVYQDGAKMLTVGGLIFSGNDISKYAATDIENLDFVREEGSKSLEILIPNLTFREIHKLESHLPNNINMENGNVIDGELVEGESTNSLFDIVPKEDVEKFADFYRYFPRFTESNV
ncbi:MAG: hypothetical protein QNK23_15490 [Crocinitomicaceae bacterium]|nr:hypothetical protein [Crocinitomicaceae bacterium]